MGFHGTLDNPKNAFNITFFADYFSVSAFDMKKCTFVMEILKKKTMQLISFYFIQVLKPKRQIGSFFTIRYDLNFLASY